MNCLKNASEVLVNKTIQILAKASRSHKTPQLNETKPQGKV